jgi:outer membrane lipoprotein-sorting protein
MRREAVCDEMRVELSARLDGEIDPRTARTLDEHLSTCAACRAEEDSLRRARAALRVQPAEPVPDLTGSIMEKVSSEGPRDRRRDDWRSGVRVASLAAAAAALLLVSTSLPFGDDPSDSAEAGEIAREVRAAAQELNTYRASFSIIERGWHPEADLRRFSARVWFDAPESFRLQVRDLTAYPDERWPANDVDLVANARRWWIEEPSTCPSEALPACGVAAGSEQRTVVQRQPFDGTSTLPTDIIVPLETLASSQGFTVLGRDTVADRSAVKVSLPYRQAIPLVDALQPGGLWREFHPLDRVEIWLDAQTWFPLRYEVYADTSKERAMWARLQGLRDRGGRQLLSVRATSFSEPDIPRTTFAAPIRGIVRSGGFSERDFGETRPWIRPAYLAALTPYRAGVTEGRRTLTYTSGMTWLKVTSGNGRAIGAETAQEVKLGDDSVAYYQPATEELKRRIDIFGKHSQVHLESNLARSKLLRVASSVGIAGKRIPRTLERDRHRTVLRLDPETALEDSSFAATPGYLPAGYQASVAVLSRSNPGGTTLTVYYRRREAEYAGEGIRVTQSPSIDLLAPSAEQSFGVTTRDLSKARWFPQRGELEWIDRDIYRSVTVPSLDLQTAVRIAVSLK